MINDRVSDICMSTEILAEASSFDEPFSNPKGRGAMDNVGLPAVDPSSLVTGISILEEDVSSSSLRLLTGAVGGSGSLSELRCIRGRMATPYLSTGDFALIGSEGISFSPDDSSGSGPPRCSHKRAAQSLE
jgi:hypothetical protein